MCFWVNSGEIPLENSSAIGTAFLAHGQAAKDSQWKEEDGAAHAAGREGILQIANATGWASPNHDDLRRHGDRSGLNHHADRRRLECSVGGHVHVGGRSTRCPLVYARYQPGIWNKTGLKTPDLWRTYYLPCEGLFMTSS